MEVLDDNMGEQNLGVEKAFDLSLCSLVRHKTNKFNHMNSKKKKKPNDK